MKVEIKFRGLSIVDNSFVYGIPFSAKYEDIIATTLITGLGHNPTTGFSVHSKEDIKPETLGQFTGLKDKAGIEMYKGDIVKYAVKKRMCKNPKCDDNQDMGVDTFCPSCGTKLVNDDFITVAEIVWDEKGAWAYKHDVDTDYYQSWKTYAAEIYIAWVEVIGNIYEHPHLLGKTVERMAYDL